MGINAYSVPRTPSTGSQFSWRRLLRPHIPHQRDASHLSQDRSRARFFGWHAKFVIPRIREEIETSGFDYRYALNEREEKTIPDRLKTVPRQPRRAPFSRLQIVLDVVPFGSFHVDMFFL